MRIKKKNRKNYYGTQTNFHSQLKGMSRTSHHKKKEMNIIDYQENDVFNNDVIWLFNF